MAALTTLTPTHSILVHQGNRRRHRCYKVRFNDRMNWDEEEERSKRGQAMRKQLNRRMVVDRRRRMQEHRDRRRAFDIFHSKDHWNVWKVQDMLHEDSRTSSASGGPQLYTQGLRAMLVSLGAPPEDDISSMLTWFRNCDHLCYSKHLRCDYEFVDTYLLYLGRAELFQKRFVHPTFWPWGTMEMTSATAATFWNGDAPVSGAAVAPSSALKTDFLATTTTVRQTTALPESSTVPFFASDEFSAGSTSIAPPINVLEQVTKAISGMASNCHQEYHPLQQSYSRELPDLLASTPDDPAFDRPDWLYMAEQHPSTMLHDDTFTDPSTTDGGDSSVDLLKYSSLRRALEYLWWTLTRRRRSLLCGSSAVFDHIVWSTSSTDKTTEHLSSTVNPFGTTCKESSRFCSLSSTCGSALEDWSDWCYHAGGSDPPSTSFTAATTSFVPPVLSGTFA